MGKIFKRYKKEDDTPTPVPVLKETVKPTPTPVTKKDNTLQNEPPQSDVERLGFFGLAKNLTTSLIAWQKAGRPVVTSEQWNERIKICRSCEFWQEVGTTNIARCKKCGCSSGKLLLATSRCPLNPPKWDTV